MGVLGVQQPGQARYSGELHNLQITQAVFGTTLPILFGTRRLAAKLLFYGGFNAQTAPSSGGKGVFGGKGTQWEYFADARFALASGSAAGGCRGLLNIWDQQGKLQNLSGSFNYTIPSGGGTVSPVGAGQPPIQMDLGVSKSVAYSVAANDYGSGGSRTLTGTQNVAMRPVTGTPGAGEYSFDAASSSYSFSSADAGASVSISYSSVWSLYKFKATQPAQVPLSAPYQVSTTNQAYFAEDGGVVWIDTGTDQSQELTADAPSFGYTESNGVYTFTSDMAGKSVYINYTFTSSDSNVTNSSTLNLAFFGGGLGQAPWSYMQSKYPGSAFGDPGICYLGANPMALGTAGTLPNYNYEVVGLNIFPGGGFDSHFCDDFMTLLDDAFLGVGFPSANIGDWSSCYAYWAANNYLGSIALDTQTSVADAMAKVIETGNVAPVWSDGKLNLIPYGDATCVGNGYTYTPNTTPAATLTWDDLLPPSEQEAGQSTSQDPLQVSQRAPQDCWNYVQAQWCNRLNDYNNELINEQNDAFIAKYGRRIESPQTWDWITNEAAASWALRLRLKRQCYIRNAYRFWLSFRFARLQVMDMVVLPTGEAVRITQISDTPDGRRAIEAEQWSYGTANVSIYPKQASASFQPTVSHDMPGDTYPVIFETPPQGSLTQLNQILIAAAGNTSSWGGCLIYASSDGQTYVEVGTIRAIGKTGILSATLASSADPDTSHTLSVDMSISGGSLTTVTQAQADNFATLSALVNSAGQVELVSFETATLTAASRFNLSYLRRGVYGTPILAHSAGEDFCYIGLEGLFEYPYPEQYIAKPIYFKFASFNLLGGQAQDLASCKVYTYTPVGTKYPAPPIVTVTASTTGPGGGVASTAGDGVTVASDGGLVTTAKVWLTIAWTWDSTFPTPTGFEVVAFTGTDPTNAANYLFPVTSIAPSVRSCTIAVTPVASTSNVYAAVEAVYA